ncbi:MAG: hypothetical protein HWE34_16290 [Methylocystaceae bacterium]|nr:hypothetical protein [Methylocystaceae bacterium]
MGNHSRVDLFFQSGKCQAEAENIKKEYLEFEARADSALACILEAQSLILAELGEQRRIREEGNNVFTRLWKRIVALLVRGI